MVRLAICAISLAAVSYAQEPSKVTFCELQKDPAAYDKKLIEISGTVSRGFENFTLYSLDCGVHYAVWLEYGGVVNSGTVYCCGVDASRGRSEPLTVAGIQTELVEDDKFREFDRLVQRTPSSTARATLVGRFFAGEKRGEMWSGYGHLGCCSLLVIQQVRSVVP